MDRFFPSLSGNLSSGVKSQLDSSFVQTDQFMLRLLLLHWAVASTVMAISHSTYLLGFIGGGLVFGIASLVYRLNPGTLISRITMGASFMAFSMIFIQQHFGQIEMHFHIFISLAFLIRYKDITPVLAATVTTALHHVLFNFAQDAEFALAGTPIMIFDYGCGLDIVAIHAAFVVVAMIVYSSIILNLTREFLKNAEVYNIIDHLSDSVQYTSDAADEISQSGQDLALAASNNSESVSTSNGSIELMNSRIETLNNKTASAKDKVERVTQNSEKMNRSMNELKVSSENITSIIKTIDSIASQTNLLALNAAVEAARAGEAGAGFAVVTDEVRVLAQKTARAANDIGDLIKDNSVKAEQGAVISEEISTQIADLMKWMDDVHITTGEQVSSLDELKRAISSISANTNNTAETAERNAATAEELQSQVHVLENIVKDLRQKVHSAGAADDEGFTDSGSNGHNQFRIEKRFQHEGAYRPKNHRIMPSRSKNNELVSSRQIGETSNGNGYKNGFH